MKTVPVRVTYLEMFDRPDIAPRAPVPRAPMPGLSVVRAVRPTIAFCRFLNEAVGGPWNWVDRTMLSDEQLAEIVHDDRVETHVLYVDGTPAGFAELDCRTDDQIELAYFGIMPDFFGQGLGRYFLDWSIDRAWSHSPKRLWVHTCELDHEAALPLYQKAGFTIFDEQMTDQRVP